MSTLTTRLQDVSARAETAPDVDVHAILADVLAGAGMAPEDAGGAVTFTGADPIVPSTLRL